MRPRDPDRDSRHRVTGSASRPAHAARPAARPAWLAAGAAAAGVAGAALLAVDAPGPTAGAPASARLITAPPRVPLPAAELAALTTSTPDFGTLAEPGRRAACLRGLGFPVAVLGARTARVAGRAAVVLVLPGTGPDDLVGVAVDADCGRDGAGLIAKTTVRRG